MTWTEFELLVGEAYRRRGYAVAEMGGPQADGGIDLILTHRGQQTYVQCKQWKALAVGVDVVRQLKGVIATHRVPHGIVVTSGRFTREARVFAAASGIELVDGRMLHTMIRSG